MSKTQAVVVGSGFGGLAAAIRLQSAGIQTTIFEKRDLPGGRAYVYRDQGFTFDAGPTVITAPDALRELFQISGRELEDYVELIPIDPFYRLNWEDGYEFNYSNDLQQTLAQINSKNPTDADGYQRFLEYAEQVFEEGYVKLGHVPFLNLWSMIRVAPQLLRLESYRTVYAMVSRYIQDPQLRQAFSFHSLLVGGNPFATSAIYCLIHSLERRWGVYFPRGGTGELVQGLIRLFQDLGGEVHLNNPVERIETLSGRVTGVSCADGRRMHANLVVSNADVVHTYDKLLAAQPQAQAVSRGLHRRRYSMSLFVLYFGTRKPYPDLAHHSVLFCERYKELLADIFQRGVLADDFSLYLHAPSVTDSSLAPEGCGSFYVLSPVPHLGKGKIDWATAGPRYRDRILEHLEQRCMPGLRENLVTTRIFTPADFRDELNAHLGSAFSLEPILTQSAWFRVHNRDAKIGGLYFVGAGTHPGAGIPGVIRSAKATAGLILSDLGLIAQQTA